MRLSFAIVVLAIYMLSVPSALHAQEGFTEAHVVFARYWTDTFAAGKDVKKREDVRQRASALPSVIEAPLTRAILDYLNNTTQISFDELRGKIAAALTPPDFGNQTIENSADVIGVDDSIVVVSYGVASCAACAENWLGIFRRSGGKYLLQTTLNDSAPNQTIHLAKVRDQHAQPVFVMYGVHLGDAHNRLNVYVYSAEKAIRKLWSKVDLPQGKIAIIDNRITLSYMSSLLPPWEQLSETYRIRNGVVSVVHKSTTPAGP